MSVEANRERPLSGVRVTERADTAAGAYAGRLLATLGATVVMLEPPTGSRLRTAAPWIDGQDQQSALFAYLGAGKRSLVADLQTDEGQQLLDQQLSQSDIFIDDTRLADRAQARISETQIAHRFPELIHVSVLPFGATGDKAHLDAEEINLVHASGEGFLLPNGYSHELFPDRPPLKIYGQFANYQGGVVAALSALSALFSEAGGQYIDVSVQDAMLLCGAFAIQRLGDGSVEHRATRRFRYGGVMEASDGFIELLTLEDRQWHGLVELLGSPDWALDPALSDPLERSVRGDEINAHIRAWMRLHDVETIVSSAQSLGVPIAQYRTPDDVLHGAHEASRQLFQPTRLADGRPADLLVAPYRFGQSALGLTSGVPALNEMGLPAT